MSSSPIEASRAAATRGLWSSTSASVDPPNRTLYAHAPMSRAIGSVQRWVLEHLDDEPLGARDLALRRVKETGGNPDTTYLSVMRAVRTLRARGLVGTDRLVGRMNDRGPGAQVHVWLAEAGAVALALIASAQ